MRKILHGFLFVFLDFNLDIGAYRIGLIPDFVGYLLILKGLSAMTAYNPRFARAKPYATGMAIYTGLLYAMDLTGFSAAFGIIPSMILGLVSTILSLKISYEIIKAVAEIESESRLDLRSDPVLLAWKFLAVTSVLTHLFIYLLPALAIIIMIIGLVAGIAFVFAFSTTTNLFEANTDGIRFNMALGKERKNP